MTAEHGGKAMTDRECTEACIKGGATYVFVSAGNVYKIENQNFADLPVHAGHTVTLKGEIKGAKALSLAFELEGCASNTRGACETKGLAEGEMNGDTITVSDITMNSNTATGAPQIR